MGALVLILALQATGDVSEYNSWRLDNLERSVNGITEILQEMREDEAVEEAEETQAMKSDIVANARDIEDIQGSITWLVRGGIGAALFGLISGAVGLVFWKLKQ